MMVSLRNLFKKKNTNILLYTTRWPWVCAESAFGAACFWTFSQGGGELTKILTFKRTFLCLSLDIFLREGGGGTLIQTFCETNFSLILEIFGDGERAEPDLLKVNFFAQS